MLLHLRLITLQFPNILVDGSVLCNCEIAAKHYFVLENLVACPESPSKLSVIFSKFSSCQLLWHLNHFSWQPSLIELHHPWTHFTYIFGSHFFAIIFIEITKRFKRWSTSNWIKINFSIEQKACHSRCRP